MVEVAITTHTVVFAMLSLSNGGDGDMPRLMMVITTFTLGVVVISLSSVIVLCRDRNIFHVFFINFIR